MERVQIKAEVREETGKKYSKKLRRDNFVPAVVYKEGKETVHLRLAGRDLMDALRTKAGANVLINLKVGEPSAKAKGKDRVVIIKEIQHHPIKDQVLHVDFQEISLTEKLTIDVPIVAKGEAEGVVGETRNADAFGPSTVIAVTNTGSSRGLPMVNVFCDMAPVLVSSIVSLVGDTTMDGAPLTRRTRRLPVSATRSPRATLCCL